MYFNGEPVEVLALGAFFSALEVILLTLLTAEAELLQPGAQQEARSDFHPLPARSGVPAFRVAVGFGNFVGAGIFGFLVNLPIVSYYEIGIRADANHAHAAAMMGVRHACGRLHAKLACATWRARGALVRPHGEDQLWSFQPGLRDGLVTPCCRSASFSLPLGQRRLSCGPRFEFITSISDLRIEVVRLPGDLL
ncbi:MAG: nitric-oxide reductase large subunit, partial [Nannocystis sp.]|nr:nitric-oxide reductase large subunit [Nannocystis sp.]